MHQDGGIGGQLLEGTTARPELNPAHSLAPALGKLLWKMSVSGSGKNRGSCWAGQLLGAARMVQPTQARLQPRLGRRPGTHLPLQPQ